MAPVPSTSPATAQTIANNLEATYQSLRQAALHMQSLLVAGHATCAEVQAYNQWALALYSTQRAMLIALRTAGQPNVPALPAYPTLFAWKGVPGDQAYTFQCTTAPASGLTGLLRDAMTPPTAATRFLSTQEVVTATQDQYELPLGPSLSALVQRADAGLGFAWLPVIAIAGVVIAIIGSAAFYGLTRYWQEAQIQEETTDRARVQAEAFKNYLGMRMSCYQDCMARGNTQDQCATMCAKFIEKPNIVIDSARAKTPDTTIIGGGAVLAVAAIASGIWLWNRRHRVFNSDSAVP